MIAEIICVGTELLLGDVINTNASFIARELAGLGICVYNHFVVGDNKGRLLNLLNNANKSDLIILTGGLGPTCDDITKETVAEFLNLTMYTDEKNLKDIKRVFESKGYEMTENNKKQALVPKDAVVLENLSGTAPGIIIEKLGKIIILLPGPPKEMETMFSKQVVPYLKGKSKVVLISKNIHIFGIGESKVEEKLYDLMQTSENPTLAPYAKEGEVLLRITCSADSKEIAIKKIDSLIEQIKNRIAKEFVYGIDIGSLQNALVSKLLKSKKKIATAESCTGGFISKRITEIPGSSNVFELGVCSYSNSMKENILKVRSETIEKFGAVSKETALEMARGIRKISGADIGISSTGIAGPSGGSNKKPVGLVYVAVESEYSSEVRELRLGSCFLNEREDIRYLSSSHALHLALNFIM